jgi:hypothetical protein
MKKVTTTLRKVAAAALVTVGALASSGAFAGAVFTVNPQSINGTGTAFDANQMSGSSSARLERTGANTYSGTGYITYSAFTLNGNTVLANVSRLNFDYQLYGTFQQTFTCPGALSVGVECTVSGISLNLYADQGTNTSFTASSVASNYGITGNGTDILLGTVTGGVGTAGINALGGAAENVITNFLLTTAGRNFFTAPDPFYTFAFSAFNNTAPGLSCNTGDGLACITPDVVAINLETGTTDFNGPARIPEPASLALLGLALAGVATARRRKSK